MFGGLLEMLDCKKTKAVAKVDELGLSIGTMPITAHL